MGLSEIGAIFKNISMKIAELKSNAYMLTVGVCYLHKNMIKSTRKSLFTLFYLLKHQNMISFKTRGSTVTFAKKNQPNN